MSELFVIIAYTQTKNTHTELSIRTFLNVCLFSDVSICEYADSYRAQRRGCVRVKKAVSSISTSIKCNSNFSVLIRLCDHA